jgi:hypothetical protein
MMCEQCAEEWGDEIYSGVEEFLDEWPDAEFGPAHVVLSDFNMEGHHIAFCLDAIAAERASNDSLLLQETEKFMRDWLAPRAAAREAEMHEP